MFILGLHRTNFTSRYLKILIKSEKARKIRVERGLRYGDLGSYIMKHIARDVILRGNLHCAMWKKEFKEHDVTYSGVEGWSVLS
jgi:hypothetical protein